MMTGFQRISRMKCLIPSDITTDPRERNVLDVGMAKINKENAAAEINCNAAFFRGSLTFYIIPFGISKETLEKVGHN